MGEKVTIYGRRPPGVEGPLKMVAEILWVVDIDDINFVLRDIKEPITYVHVFPVIAEKLGIPKKEISMLSALDVRDAVVQVR